VLAHAYNPRSGGSLFEASPGKYFVRLHLEKNPSQERAGEIAQGVGPEFKPQYYKKKKTKKKERKRGYTACQVNIHCPECKSSKFSSSRNNISGSLSLMRSNKDTGSLLGEAIPY
jgi:hypothetical protein